MPAIPVASRRLAVLPAVALLAASGCSMAGGTLGGRETCWPESDARMASLWRGVLQIDDSRSQLLTPDGETIPFISTVYGTVVPETGAGELTRGDQVVARSGDDVTVFGGAGADGLLILCAIEEIHAHA